MSKKKKRGKMKLRIKIRICPAYRGGTVTLADYASWSQLNDKGATGKDASSQEEYVIRNYGGTA